MLILHFFHKIACFYHLDIHLHVNKRYFSFLKNSVQYRSFQMFKALIVLFTIFTLLDTLVTRVGLGIGCIELNPFITTTGLSLWTLFRIGLLAYLLTGFFAGYRFFQNHFSKGLSALNTSLVILNIYIGTIVFSGIFTILSKLLI